MARLDRLWQHQSNGHTENNGQREVRGYCGPSIHPRSMRGRSGPGLGRSRSGFQSESGLQWPNGALRAGGWS